MTRIIVLASTVLLLAGCATVSKEEVATADFGPEPVGYQEAIKTGMTGKLKDPYSAMYRFGTPRKGFVEEGALAGFKKHYGYIVEVGINAKNSFGGYVGEQIYYFIITDSKVYDITQKFTLPLPTAKYVD